MLHKHQSRKLPISFTRQELVLVLVTMVWGGTFLVVHKAMQEGGPLLLVGMRFIAAGLATLLIFHRRLRGLTRGELFAGGAIGLSIFLGYYLQTLGLKTISSSQSAFITAFYVPLAPIFQWAIMKKPPRLAAWIGIGLAFAGLVLLAGPDAGGLSLGQGQVMTLLSTVAIAVEIVLISRFATGVDSARVTVVQLFVAGLTSLALVPVVREPIPPMSPFLVGAAIGLGLASAAIQLAMNWAQKSVSATRAAIIYAGEPVWAGLVGRIAGERLPAMALAGGALVVAGVIASELKIERRLTGRRSALPKPSRSGATSEVG